MQINYNSTPVILELRSKDMIQKIIYHKMKSLSARELQILHLIAYGYSNKVIAHKLNLSQRTVENHRMSITHKLEANSHSMIAIMLMLGIRECLPYCVVMKKCYHECTECPIRKTLSEP